MGFFSKKDKKEDKENTDKKSAKVVVDSKEEENKQSMKDLYGGGEVSRTKKDTGDKKETPTTAKQERVGKTDKKSRKFGNAYRVLIKPLITEKAANLGVESKYLFEVSPRANKIEIAKAVDELYGIKPISVNIINMGGKSVRYGRIRGKRKDWKKAVVTLPKGSTINIYEGV